MHILLLQFYDETPISIEKIQRRTAFLGKILSQSGTHVTWIKSGFSHTQKKPLHGNSVRFLNEHYKIIHVPGLPYPSNGHIKRYWNDWVCTKQMLPMIKTFPKIDGMVVSIQNLVGAFCAAYFAKKHNIPLIVDIRDPWPDAFCYVVRRPILRFFLKKLLFLDQFFLKTVLRNATAIVAVSNDMLQWGLRKIPNVQKPTRIFYLSSTPDVSLSENQEKIFQEKYASIVSRKTFKCFYISKWGINFQPAFLIEAARALQKESVDFVLVGDGDYGDKIREQAKSLPNVYCPGFLSNEEAFFLAKHCDCGVVFLSKESEKQFFDLTPTFPNKAFFYFMCGLPILNSMPGEIAEIVDAHALGLNFPSNDLASFQKKLLHLRDEPLLRKSMAEHSRMFFEQQGNPEKTYLQYAQFVKSFCV